MPDAMSPAQRSALMSRVRHEGTWPEEAVFSALRLAGLRFRRHDRSLPGSPDAVFRSERVAVFVEGNFWHGWHFPKWRDKLPVFWREKIERNRRRDRRNAQKLRRSGWRVVRLWEHQVKRDVPFCVQKVSEALDRQRGGRTGRSSRGNRGLTR